MDREGAEGKKGGRGRGRGRGIEGLSTARLGGFAPCLANPIGAAANGLFCVRLGAGVPGTWEQNNQLSALAGYAKQWTNWWPRVV